MGNYPIHYNSTMLVILLLIVAAAFVSAEPSAHEESAPSMEAPEADLLAVVKELRGYTDGTALASHGMRIEDHANLIQKARAYKHSFGARNALRAAIRALVSELTSGHNHDRNALNNSATLATMPSATHPTVARVSLAATARRPAPPRRRRSRPRLPATLPRAT